jgi:RNA polymerase sigma factor (sigma-70 family)
VRNDRWLARRAARGDQEAFAAIFRRHEQDLYRYCVAILGDPEDAQDALQNAMVKALRALPGERREIALKPWLYRIAHNEAIELRRRERPSEPFTEDLPAPGASLEQSAAERERLRQLLDDLARLPDRHRGALVMRELAGLGFEQIGAALETTPAAARQVLYEARRGLREMAAGRDLACEEVMETVSAADGRVSRRRDIRAHLRDCEDCRAFAAEIEGRKRTLAGIAPLPAGAAAVLLKGAFGSAGGAVGGGGAAAVGSSTPAGIGAAAGAATKAGGAATLVKSALGVAAIVAVGTVAADHGHLPHLVGGGEKPAAEAGRSTGAGGEEGSHVAVEEIREEGRAQATGGALGAATARGPRGSATSGPGAARGGRRPHGHEDPTGATRPGHAAAPGADESHLSAGPDAAGTARPGRPAAPGAKGHAAKGSPPRPVHPSHPEHPAAGHAAAGHAAAPGPPGSARQDAEGPGTSAAAPPGHAAKPPAPPTEPSPAPEPSGQPPAEPPDTPARHAESVSGAASAGAQAHGEGTDREM